MLELTFITSRGVDRVFFARGGGGVRPLTVVGSVPIAYNFWICGTVQCKVHFTTNLAPVFTRGNSKHDGCGSSRSRLSPVYKYRIEICYVHHRCGVLQTD